jgi:hypothetical protein
MVEKDEAKTPSTSPQFEKKDDDDVGPKNAELDVAPAVRVTVAAPHLEKVETKTSSPIMPPRPLVVASPPHLPPTGLVQKGCAMKRLDMIREREQERLSYDTELIRERAQEMLKKRRIGAKH